MTVKPPGGLPPTPPDLPATQAKKPVAGESFQVGGPAVEASRVPEDVAAEVTSAVREGRMTVEQAVETIVDRTLQDPAFARLSADRLEALRTELREVLASDPVLSTLTGQIAR